MDIPKLNTSDPDFLIEEFWYGCKNAMVNFYSWQKIPWIHIELWSDNLNKLKADKEYNKIEEKITEYITFYSFDLTKHSDADSYYHDDILITYIKRWDKISSQFNFIKSQTHNKILNLFKIFLELKKDPNGWEPINIIEFKNKNSNLKPIEILLDTNNYDELINWALSNDKSKILELLGQIINLDSRIHNLFPDFEFPKNIRGIKLCRLFTKYQNSNN
jgi:hypothetical protein